jgi:type II secretory pathway component PulJ
MTLVEMLVATTCTLILMGAIAQVFGAFGTAVSDSRSMIELDAQLRSAAWRLRNDLAGATARTLPPLEVEAGEGYLEIIEGPRNETASGANGDPLAAADTDDVLLFTTRNTETPYLGKYTSDLTTPGTTQIQESQLAEVGWFLRRTDTAAAGNQQVKTFTLFRKQLLVVGYVGFTPFYNNRNSIAPMASWASFYELFDLSVQFQQANNVLLPNTLADLTRRENRFQHNPTGQIDEPAGAFRFPSNKWVLGDWQADAAQDGLVFNNSARAGEDVVLTNVIAFDVRVFDPSAPVSVSGDTALVPGDTGLGAPSANGAFVDLGWAKTVPRQFQPIVNTCGYRPRFAAMPEPLSGLPNVAGVDPCVWDTWSTHYESNGFDDDNINGRDQGSNGIDDDGDGKVDESPYDADGDGLFTGGGDDPGELETLPPYRFPLRGIEIRLRCYEPSSRQVRQVTIRHSFVPR